jgi:colanic acid/amylovoran biosynthesis glycosyltransferase
MREAAKWLARRTGMPWQMSGREAREIVEIYRRAGVSVVHIFSGNAALHALPVLRQLPVPALVSFHGSDVSGEFAAPGAKAVRAEIFHRAGLVACRSADLAEAVAALGCPQEKLRVMRAVLPEAILDRLRSAPAGGARRFLAAGRLVAKKGHATAIAAYAKLLRKMPDARLTIAGDGPLAAPLAAQARKLGVDVDFVGFLSEEDLRTAFLEHDVFLQPSEVAAGDREGIPNALLEAMSAGLPCIATRHGGIQEVIEHGTSGLLIPEGQPAELAKSMQALAESAELWNQLSQGAHARFLAEFAAEHQISRINDLYREAAAGLPASRNPLF